MKADLFLGSLGSSTASPTNPSSTGGLRLEDFGWKWRRGLRSLRKNGLGHESSNGLYNQTNPLTRVVSEGVKLFCSFTWSTFCAENLALCGRIGERNGLMSDPNSYRGGLMVTSESSPDSMLHRNRQRKQRDGLLEKQKHAHTQDLETKTGLLACPKGPTSRNPHLQARAPALEDGLEEAAPDSPSVQKLRIGQVDGHGMGLNLLDSEDVCEHGPIYIYLYTLFEGEALGNDINSDLVRTALGKDTYGSPPLSFLFFSPPSSVARSSGGACSAEEAGLRDPVGAADLTLLRWDWSIYTLETKE